MNLIQIKPVDTDIQLRANAVRILNEFKALGFTVRGAFVEVVLSNDPHYNQFELIKKLTSFWDGRVKDKNLNDDLERVLEKLKSE